MFRYWIWPILTLAGCVIAVIGTTLPWGIRGGGERLVRMGSPGLPITGWGARLTNKTDEPLDLADDLQLHPGETVIFGPRETAKILAPDGRTKRVYPGINPWLERPLGAATMFLGLLGAALVPMGFRPGLAKFIYRLSTALVGVWFLFVLALAVVGALTLPNAVFFLLVGLAGLSLPLLGLQYRVAPFLFLAAGLLGLASCVVVLFEQGWKGDVAAVSLAFSLICGGLGLAVLIRKDAVARGFVPLAIGTLMFLFSAGSVVWSVAGHVSENVSIAMAMEYFAPFRECWTGVAVTVPGALLALIAAIGWVWSGRIPSRRLAKRDGPSEQVSDIGADRSEMTMRRTSRVKTIGILAVLGGVLLGAVALTVVWLSVSGEEGGPLPARKPFPWPDGAGYLAPPQMRPAQPHSVEPARTEYAIVGMLDGGMMECAGHVEVRAGEFLQVHPGCTITCLLRTPDTMKMSDYNGDECTLVYGLTVKVDDYGQFVPVRYDPEAKPPEKVDPLP